MSFQLNIPPSMVTKMAKKEEVGNDGADGAEGEESASKKREDWKKLKELEEARKAGTAPAMQDEEGKDINPHIPQYIMQAPWYFGATTPTLRHQRPQDEKQKQFSQMDDWYNRGVKQGSVATKFRKGSCQNCGALTHQKKDCMERPRKVGAQFTGQEIAPDEFMQPQLSFDYDGKRDRWNGYDPDEHKKIVEEYSKVDEAKRVLKAQRLEKAVLNGESEEVAREGLDSEEEEDEDKYADDVDMPGQKFETKQRITVRNLRIREDTAKYLRNLDPNSAYYDPKTRSMRENPNINTVAEDRLLSYSGDNFVRWSGDAHEMAKRQIFAWQAYEKGAEVHLQADPTKLQVLANEYSRKKGEYKSNQKQSIVERYGGEEHLEAPDKQLLLAQSEDYVEYSRHGTIIKGQEKAKVKSRYEEDVYINNHTSVWGSFWNEGHWGFKCCHSCIKESYCTGEAGKVASESTIPALTSGQDQEDVKAEVQKQLEEQRQLSSQVHQEKAVTEEKKAKKKKSKKKKSRKKKKAKKHSSRKRKRRSSSSDSSSSDSSSDSESEAEEEKREQRIKEAMKREEEREKQIEKMMAMDERKRPYNSMFEVHLPTEEEMEAYRRKRLREDDPMAQFL